MATDGDGDGPGGHLRRVYGIEAPVEVRDYYDSWAPSYDAELEENSYASPTRVAAALAGLVGDLTAPVLDYGCGTGMSGQALRTAGFTTIDGADPSTGMLNVAEAKGIYRRLVALDVEAERPPFTPGEYGVVTAIGVIGPGAAPLSLFDRLLQLLPFGGFLGLSFNDRALQDPAFPAAVTRHTSGGRVSVAFEEHGPHLPGLGVDATVYVLRCERP